MDLLAAVLRVLAVAFLILLSPVLYTVAYGIVGGTFLSGAFTRAREMNGGETYPARSSAAEVGVAVRGVGWELRRLLRFLGWTVLVAILALVPGGAVLAIPVEALLAAHILAWELLTPHFEGLGLGYRDQKRFLFRHPALTLGLGGVSLLLLLVPFAQPLVAYTNQAAAGALSARLR